jgi:hypothetical protein
MKTYRGVELPWIILTSPYKVSLHIVRNFQQFTFHIVYSNDKSLTTGSIGIISAVILLLCLIGDHLLLRLTRFGTCELTGDSRNFVFDSNIAPTSELLILEAYFFVKTSLGH